MLIQAKRVNDTPTFVPKGAQATLIEETTWDTEAVGRSGGLAHPLVRGRRQALDLRTASGLGRWLTSVGPMSPHRQVTDGLVGRQGQTKAGLICLSAPYRQLEQERWADRLRPVASGQTPSVAAGERLLELGAYAVVQIPTTVSGAVGHAQKFPRLRSDLRIKSLWPDISTARRLTWEYIFMGPLAYRYEPCNDFPHNWFAGNQRFVIFPRDQTRTLALKCDWGATLSTTSTSSRLHP
jgi:hypothetical protein